MPNSSVTITEDIGAKTRPYNWEFYVDNEIICHSTIGYDSHPEAVAAMEKTKPPTLIRELVNELKKERKKVKDLKKEDKQCVN